MANDFGGNFDGSVTAADPGPGPSSMDFVGGTASDPNGGFNAADANSIDMGGYSTGQWGAAVFSGSAVLATTGNPYLAAATTLTILNMTLTPQSLTKAWAAITAPQWAGAALPEAGPVGTLNLTPGGQ